MSSCFSTTVARLARACAVGGIALLAACGGSDEPTGTVTPPPPPPPTPSVTVALSRPDLTVLQGENGTATVTVARTNYTGPLTLTLEGLPEGITGTLAPATLDAGTATSTLTLAPATTMAAGFYAVQVKAAGTNVEASSESMALIVQARPAPVARVATVTITALVDTIEAFDALQLGVVLRDSINTVLTGRAVTWTSSDPTVATVAANGLVTGVDRGTVTLRATSEGVSDAASLVVVIRYRSISSGSMHACDIASGGRVYCWGLNGNEGRVGSTVLGPNAYVSQPLLLPIAGRVTQLSTYGRTSCAVTMQGQAWCWGYNGWGTLGAGSNAGFSVTPVQVAGGLSFRSVSVGSDHACGVTVDHRGWCWGNNEWRQLGTGTSAASSVPVAVAGNIAFQSINAGQSFTCGVSTTNEAWCWGANQIGQVGDGGQISYGNVFVALPQRVSGGVALAGVSSGTQYACGRTASGQGYCWGSNNGKFGNGPGTDTSSPMPIAGGLSFRSISAGYGHACGVTLDEQAWCWGSNGHGQLGVPLPNGSTVPVRAGGSIRVAEVAAAGIATGSAVHTCAISADRLTAWCWGRNDVGQLGNGSTTSPTASNPTPAIVTGQKPL